MPHAIAIVDLRDNFYSICMYLMFTDIFVRNLHFQPETAIPMENKNWLHEYTARVRDSRCICILFEIFHQMKWNEFRNRFNQKSIILMKWYILIN